MGFGPRGAADLTPSFPLCASGEGEGPLSAAASAPRGGQGVMGFGVVRRAAVRP